MKIVVKNMIESRDEEYALLTKDAEEGRILFLGDSITEMFRTNEYFAKVHSYNRGISGDTSDGVLSRLETNIYPLKPSKIFLMIGTNDFGMGKKVEYVFDNIMKIIDNLKANCPNSKIYLESVFPVRQPQSGRRNNKDIDALNLLLQENKLGKEYVYIEINSLLKDKKGKLRSELTIDGIHLKMGGYMIVRKKIEAFVEE